MGAGLSAMQDFIGRKEQRILMTGLDNSGKTTISHTKKLEVVTTIPTGGLFVKLSTVKDGYDVVTFTTYDTGGRINVRPLKRSYYKNTDAIVFVIDSADRRRMEEARHELMEMMSEDLLRNSPVLVFANKQDLLCSMSESEVVDALNLKSLSNRRWFVKGCCAKSGQGLDEGFEWLKLALAPGQDCKAEQWQAPVSLISIKSTIGLELGKGPRAPESIADTESTADTITSEDGSCVMER